MTEVQWRTSNFYGGDVAWFNGVLYRIVTLGKRKYEVAFGGHFFRQWETFGVALSKAEAVTMCENHAIADAVMPED